MNRLQKFVEHSAFGERPGRVAYVLDHETLPAPADGLEWRAVRELNAGEEILANPGLKAVFKEAIDSGWAIVTPE
jgi:hypothetical protein